MSISKNIIEETEKHREIALEVLENVAAIEWCLCHRIFRQGKNFEYAYEYGTKKAKEKYHNEEINFKILHEQFEKILSEALIDDKCPNCEE